MKTDANTKTVLLETCHDSALLARWERELDAAYTKRDLTAILTSVLGAFAGYTFRLSGEPWALRIETALYPTAKKDEMVAMVARIFASPANRDLLMHTLDETQKMIWQAIYTQVYLPLADAEKMAGRTLIERRKLYYSPYAPKAETPEELNWIKAMALDWRSNTILVIPEFFRQAFGGLFTPELPERHPGEEDVKVYNAEFAALSVMPVLHTLYLSGALDMGRYRLQAMAVNKLVKQLSYPAFAAVEKDTMTQRLSTWMIANIYALYAEEANLRKGKRDVREMEMRKMLSTVSAHPHRIFPIVAGFLDKATQAVMGESSYWNIYAVVTDFITSRPAGEWIDADALMGQVYRMPDLNTSFKVMSNKAFAESCVSNLRNSGTIRYSNVGRYLTLPCVLGTVALFASMGLVEVEYTVAAELDPSPLWGLRRLRLTPLGAYAFKLTKEYKAPEIEERVYFVPDTERLILRAIGENNPYEGMISEYLRPVGGRRFAASPLLMLARCHSPHDLDTRIEEFKALVGKKLPRVWEDFLEGLRANCGKVHPTRETYITLRVDPEDRDLQRLVTTDPEIKKLCLKAENYTLLVEADRLEAFRLLLADHGYLM